ncbi:MAG: phosphoribosylformylglycinamidine synthase subunit PurL [Candidatus Peribacteraceae bacterium]|nr:phosphoribosylformylglycinamidine synthase subunit PurL [Candidatus Peribacteraceae bacterium]
MASNLMLPWRYATSRGLFLKDEVLIDTLMLHNANAMKKVSAPAASVLAFSKMNDSEVKAALTEHRIGLTVSEARKVSTMLKRDPTVVEAVIWGIQGSEHCSYKSSRRFLKTLLTKGQHVILGPGEDSGIVAITDAPKGERWGFVVSHESHNHPSQIVPFEGAATGIGGVVRDVVCMGARVIGCMDNLRLGDLQTEESTAIAKEVARGIAGYGNPLGIPNLGGDTVFDASYNSNCLVNAIAFGIVKENEIIHSTVPEEAGKVGYDIIIVGKPTDFSGFGGASFASSSMEEDKREANAGAVQEPNPFLERHLLASTYALFDWLVKTGNLPRVSFKDLGAGGVVCASVEQVADRGFGAEVELADVHVSVTGLPAEVIACAETQERFCWICHPDLTAHILDHYNKDWDLPSIAENARASRIGSVTETGVYHLTYRGETVCEAKALDITCGLQYVRPTKPRPSPKAEPLIRCEGDRMEVQLPGRSFKTRLSDVFHALLSHPSYGSPSPVIRHYDKDIIGISVIEAGEADAGVIAPLRDLPSFIHVGTHPGWDVREEDRFRGVAVSADGRGRYGRISPYLQGFNAAVEAMRNVAAVGAIPRALTDCLNYGNPEIPEQLWELEEGVRGIGDAAASITMRGEHVPVISGNVSLYNGRPDGSAIDPTAVVCCIGILPDARKAVTMQLKSADSLLLMVGDRRDECGGGAYYEVLESLAGTAHDQLLGFRVPTPDPTELSRQIELVTSLTDEGMLRSCHDISDGGLLLALFEMTLPQRKIGGSIGVNVDLAALESDLRSDTLLFSETGGFLLEIDRRNEQIIRKRASALKISICTIGSTLATPTLRVNHGPTTLLNEDLGETLKIWNLALKSRFE